MAKKTEQATLYLHVRFNPKMTDAEGLAVAMDTLLETAMSTPGIMDDYGEVSVTEHLVMPATLARKL